MSRITAILLAASITTLLGGAGIARAGQSVVYEWTDAHGEVHYSDQWVAGAKRIRIQTSAGSASSSSAMQGIQSEDQAASREIEHEDAARAVQQDEAKARAAKCAHDKTRYDALIESRRIYRTDKSGKRQYLSDAQANAVRLKAREAMQADCGAGS